MEMLSNQYHTLTDRLRGFGKSALWDPLGGIQELFYGDFVKKTVHFQGAAVSDCQGFSHPSWIIYDAGPRAPSEGFSLLTASVCRGLGRLK